MERILLLPLIVLLQTTVWVARSQDVTDATFVDGGNDTDIDVRNETEKAGKCEWNISGLGEIRISWSGNASEESEVVVEGKVLNDTECNFKEFKTERKFKNKFVDVRVPVCPNDRYEITIQLNCSIPESRRIIWTPPEAPRNVSIENVENASFVVRWTKPLGKGSIELYNVSVTESGGNTFLKNTTEEQLLISHLKPWTIYGVRVAAKNKDFWGTYSEETKQKTKAGIPHPPTDLAASNVTNTSLLITWSEPEPSTGPIESYSLRWNSSRGEGSDTTQDLSYHVTGLLPYLNYTFSVSASTDAGQGEWSEGLSIQTDIGVPHPPTDLAASNVTNTSLLITWSEPEPSTGPIESYGLRWNSSRGEGSDTTQDLSYHVTGLLPYLNYTFSVSASTDAGRGEWSEGLSIQTDIGVPSSPRNLRCSQKTNISLSLTWNRPEFPNAPQLDYILTYNLQLGSDVPKIEKISAPADQQVVQFMIRNLLPYTNYSVQVFASNPAGQTYPVKVNCHTDIGVPHPPTHLAVSNVTNTSLLITWSEPKPSTGPIIWYSLRWDSSRGGGSNTTQDRSYHATGLLPYLNYTFSVSASTDAGQGEWSESLSIQTDIGVPSPPRNLRCFQKTNTSLSLMWDPPEFPNSPNLSYSLIYKMQLRDDFPKVKTIPAPADPGTVTFVVRDLLPYTFYSIQVSAINLAGQSYPVKVIDQTEIGVPHPPTHLATSNVTNTSLLITWSEPEPSTGPIKLYSLRWNSSRGRGSNTTQDRSYQATGLLPYLNYTFSVSASTDAGQGEWSESLSIQTDIGVPSAPRNVRCFKKTNTSLSLTWHRPEFPNGPALAYIVTYKVQMRDDVPEMKTISAPADPDTVSFVIRGLLPYTLYSIQVSASNPAGQSPPVTMINQTEIGVPHPPTHLAASNVTNTSLLITWSEPKPSTGPIESYSVRWNSSRGGGSNITQDRSYNATGLLPYLYYTVSVSASTHAGQGEWSESLLIQTDIGVPSAPRNLRCSQKTNISLTLMWNRPEFPNGPALELEYLLVYRLQLRDDVPKVKKIPARADQEILSFVVGDLLPYTYYSVQVSASNPAGQSHPDRPVIDQTEIGVPQPAEILDVYASQGRKASVRWKTEGPYPGPVDYSLRAWKWPGICSTPQTKTLAEEIKGSRSGGEEWRSEQVTEVLGLTPFGQYYFQILLRTSATRDESVVSRESDTIRIDPEAPSEPLNVRAECIGSPTQLKISWRPPRYPNGRITSYLIHYGIERPDSSFVYEVDDVCQSQSYVLTGLRPERRYHISVSGRVENVSEDGLPARARNVCTLPPGIPFLGDTSGVEAAGSGPYSLELVWTEDTFSDYMGTIVRYAVLVGKINSLGNATRGHSATTGPPWFNFSSGLSDFYQATPPGWNPFRDAFDPLSCRISFEMKNKANRTFLRCTLGLDEECPVNGTYCNGPLQPDTSYEMKIRAFTRGGFTETDLIYARSKPVPKPNVVGRVVAVVMVLFLLVALVGGGYVLKKKGHMDTIMVYIQSRLNPKEGEPEKREDPAIPMEECTSPRPVKTRDFAEHVRIMMSDSHLKFSLEFEKLKNESPRLPCTVAEMEENRSKNRWMNIFPFDHSRVKLLPLCDEPGSDFINANYIPGYSSRREYIATQGPLPQVLDDFWRMVWEQSVSVMVMLTQCVERGKKKCEKYWPDSGDTAYHGDLRITTVSVSMLSSYIIRIFHVQSGSYERLVKQMHFTHWPDFGCPESPEDLINFVNAVREHLPRVAPGPILVHCSAGVGRTGTFIAVDRLMLQLRHAPNPGEDTVDIYGTVLDLRQHRTNMVQTEDQYIYIHLCVRQLIEDRDRPPDTGSQENIYSNLAIELDSPSHVKPSAPALPL